MPGNGRFIQLETDADMTTDENLYKTPISDVSYILRQRSDQRIVGFVDESGCDHTFVTQINTPDPIVDYQSASPIIINAQTSAALGRYDASKFTHGTLVISGLTSETVQIKPVYRDGADVGASVGVYVRKADGTLAQATALGNGTYNIETIFCDSIDIVKSAAVESLTLRAELRGDISVVTPQNYYREAVTAAAVGKFGMQGANTGKLIVSGLVSETVKIQPVFADSQDVGARGILVKNAAGTIVEALTLGNGLYNIETIAYPQINITKSAGVNPLTIQLEIK